MSHGNGSAPKVARVGGERLYPFPDDDMGIAGADEPVVERHVRRYVEAVEAAHQVVGDGADWLDIACGSGYGAPVVAKANPATYTGVDASDEAIAYARRHFAGDGQTFELAAFPDWQPKREYGAVLSIETIEHLLRAEQWAFVHKLFGCLVPGGVLVLSCPIGDGAGRSANPFHLHEPTADEIMQYMGPRLTRFHVERTEGTFGPFWQCYAVGVK